MQTAGVPGFVLLGKDIWDHSFYGAAASLISLSHVETVRKVKGEFPTPRAGTEVNFRASSPKCLRSLSQRESLLGLKQYKLWIFKEAPPSLDEELLQNSALKWNLVYSQESPSLSAWDSAVLVWDGIRHLFSADPRRRVCLQSSILSIGDSVTCFSICISDFSAWRHKLVQSFMEPSVSMGWLVRSADEKFWKLRIPV